MANPAVVACAADAWTLVKANVTSALILSKNIPIGGLYYTYRLNLGAAPTGLSEAIPIKEGTLNFTASAASDIYVYAKGGAGSVRVDV